MVKSQEEITLIRHGAEICDIGAQAFTDAVTEGITEVQLARTSVTAMEEEMENFRSKYYELLEDNVDVVENVKS